MNKLLVGLLLLSSSLLSAQTTISDFSSPLTGPYLTESGSWTGQTSVSGGILTIGGSADDAGGIFEALITTSPIPIDGSTLLSLTVTARIDLGNVASGFSILLFDDVNGAIVALAEFNANDFTSGFTSVTENLVITGLGNLADVQSFGFSGPGAEVAFRFSFDQIIANSSVIPEPSTYAAIFGAMALAFVAYRRRQKAA